MRISVPVLILICAGAMTLSAANSKAQGALDKPVTIDVRNQPLGVVLDVISQQVKVNFTYGDNVIFQTKLNYRAEKERLGTLLDKLLKDYPYTFTVVDDDIILVYAPQKLEKVAVLPPVTGKVVDEKGEPLQGATIRLKGTNVNTVTDKQGRFRLENVPTGTILIVSFIGYQAKEIPVITNVDMTVDLQLISSNLSEVTVSTGYQTLPKERATGSFEQINNELFNRKVSTNIFDRLNGITTGFYFQPNFSPTIATSPTNKNTGITIRGVSTYFSSTDPLIVVDNFPYEGEISNINPNDIESISILKDAAAASIWGARSGNGVIVLTTKKGRKNEHLKISFNSNYTVQDKPNLFKLPGVMSSVDYVAAETYLFNQGYFNSDINNTTSRPPVSPAVEIMAKQRAGTISAADATTQLDVLRNTDVRSDYEKYVYQKATSQQYALGFQGGTEATTYSLGLGYDKNNASLIKNGFERISINTFNTYNPIKKLELSAGINYSRSTTELNNQFAYGTYSNVGGKYIFLYPYARLADDNGNPATVLQGIREAYLTDAESKGFLDWHYRPLNDIYNADNTSGVNDLLVRLGIKYQVLPHLSASIDYQDERQIIQQRNYRSQDMYYTRNLINKYSVYNATTKAFTYNFPLGSILSLNNYDWDSQNARGQLNYNHSFSKHSISAILGSEIRQLKTTGTGVTLYGYDDQFGTANGSLNFTTSFPTNPNGSALLPGNTTSVSGVINRFIAYYANGSYTYNDKYTVTLSGRKDGANLFGARTNDRVTPLWSAGALWDLGKESFYHFFAMPHLQLRGTIGYNGNIYQNGSAYLTGRYFADSNTGAQDIANVTAPNPDLKWERVRNFNLGINFGLKNDILTGSIEYYIKDGRDLIQQTALAPQTGFASYYANTADTHNNGWDITLISHNVDKKFKWSTILLFSTLKDKVVKYDAPYTLAKMTTSGGVVGKSLFGLFVYKWAGLDPANGNPRGYLNGQVSEDYSGIVNNFKPDSLVYAGTQRPSTFGSLRNDFSYKSFSLSVNIIYKFGYVFLRPAGSINYVDILGTGASSDFASRWQKPGDELTTSVPSYVYPSNANRYTFYRYSEALVQEGDHIRIQDIRFSYDLPSKWIKRSPVNRLQLYAYASNIGIIWRKNKYDIDPDAIGQYSAPFSCSIGLSAGF